ncbi:hypothetical protein C0995_002123, partial [Termitomyces sp. Mi166
MEVDNESSYPHLINTSTSATLSELGASQDPSDASLGPLRAFYQVVQPPKTKPEPKGKGVQGDLSKDKAQAIVKCKGKEKEQELSAVADKQLAILLQHLHDTGILKE